MVSQVNVDRSAPLVNFYSRVVVPQRYAAAHQPADGQPRALGEVYGHAAATASSSRRTNSNGPWISTPPTVA